MSYHGYGRFIVHRIDGEFEKYELMHSEITQFGHTVPYRSKFLKIKGSNLKQVSEALKNPDKLNHPNVWLDEYVSSSMPYELENMIDANDFEVELDGYAEVCGLLLVTDTSSDTPCGYEYDSEFSLEEPEFTPFKLEDLKQSGYYNARWIAEWERGCWDEEYIEERYNELVAEGYMQTWEHLENDPEALQEEYRKMMEPSKVPLDTLTKQADLDEAEDGMISIKNWYPKYKTWFAKTHTKESAEKRSQDQGYDMWEEPDVRQAYGEGFKEAIRLMEKKYGNKTRTKR